VLVLSRKESEQIKIGENVVLTIVRIKGVGVQIGIEAPKEVRVLRAELEKGEPRKQSQ
jgi:carbon storage regulator